MKANQFKYLHSEKLCIFGFRPIFKNPRWVHPTCISKWFYFQPHQNSRLLHFYRYFWGCYWFLCPRLRRMKMIVSCACPFRSSSWFNGVDLILWVFGYLKSVLRLQFISWSQSYCNRTGATILMFIYFLYFCSKITRNC